jgi:calcium-translocating P-type ATPase
MTVAIKATNGATTSPSSISSNNGGIEATTSGLASPNYNDNLNNGSNRDLGSRFGGLAAAVETSMASSVDVLASTQQEPFCVTAQQLGELSVERTRAALAQLLKKGITAAANKQDDEEEDVEGGDRTIVKLHHDIQQLGTQLELASSASEDDHGHQQVNAEADRLADMAANVVTTVLLRSDPERGLDPRQVERHREIFGSNGIADKELDSFLNLCWEAVQDFVLIMLIVLGIIGIVVNVTTLKPGERCTTCWIEGAAILASVVIVVIVTAGIDYAKQFAFIKLTRSLHETNTKAVIRGGKQLSVTDDDVVVGDILSVNSHNMASIPADCILLGPESGLKMDESSLTGESKLMAKKPGDVVLSGTNAMQGSGKMVVIAVGIHSVAGKIRARVYETETDENGDELGGDDDNSPLFVKLDLIAKRIGMAGTVAASMAFIGSCIIGLGINKEPAREIIKYLVTAITVLAVAVPEGLPLAVTLSLAFSSNKMMREQNLVKHLDACETMGCATTICTDKTGG